MLCVHPKSRRTPVRRFDHSRGLCLSPYRLFLSRHTIWRIDSSILCGGPNRTGYDALRPGGHAGRSVVRGKVFLSRNSGDDREEQMQHHDGYINPTRDAKPTAARNTGHQGNPIYSTPGSRNGVSGDPLRSWGGRSGRDRATEREAKPQTPPITN